MDEEQINKVSEQLGAILSDDFAQFADAPIASGAPAASAPSDTADEEAPT